MSWVTTFLTSPTGKKVIMSLSGLFLCTFLAIHMSGNMALVLNDDGGAAFNAYAAFMTTFLPVKIVSYITYGAILLHIFQGLLLWKQNRAARPVGYEKKSTVGSTWASRNMALLGTIILVFLVVHLYTFWFQMHWGGIPLDANGNKDLYALVVEAFSQWWYVVFYLIALAALAYHLMHGIQSGFQSLGLSHSKYTPIVKIIGYGFGIIIPLLFALQPIAMFIKSMS